MVRPGSTFSPSTLTWTSTTPGGNLRVPRASTGCQCGLPNWAPVAPADTPSGTWRFSGTVSSGQNSGALFVRIS
jgi:hypothetical protein